MKPNPSLMVPISAGELIDKISILKIKRTKLKSSAALLNVKHELRALKAVRRSKECLNDSIINSLASELDDINIRLWEVEDSLRLLEAKQRFDNEFIQLARSVYQLNDKRACIKRKINDSSGSELTEEKSYATITND